MRFLSPKTKVQNYAIPLFDLSEVCSLEHNWRKIPIALVDPDFGEQKAQGCENACLRQLLIGFTADFSRVCKLFQS
jgi:hypothetical protein